MHPQTLGFWVYFPESVWMKFPLARPNKLKQRTLQTSDKPVQTCRVRMRHKQIKSLVISSFFCRICSLLLTGYCLNIRGNIDENGVWCKSRYGNKHLLNHRYNCWWRWDPVCELVLVNAFMWVALYVKHPIKIVYIHYVCLTALLTLFTFLLSGQAGTI